jgi:hypothetical protein
MLGKDNIAVFLKLPCCNDTWLQVYLGTSLKVPCYTDRYIFISPYLEPDQDKSTCHYRSGVYTQELKRNEEHWNLKVYRILTAPALVLW